MSRMSRASINSAEIHYEATGEGNAVLFHHGMTGSTEDWAKQVPLVAGKHKAIAMDLRGQGRSSAPLRVEDYSMPIFAEDIRGVLEHVGVSKACIVGHSIGGFTALEFALAHPEMVTALVLVDTSSGERGAFPGYAEFRDQLLEIMRAKGMATAFDFDCANNPQRIDRYTRHPELKDYFRPKMLRTSVDGYIGATMAMANWKWLTPRLSEITVPTIIFWGDEDAPFEKASQVIRDGIAGAELVVVHGSGHNPHEEKPGVFNEALMRFLDRIGW